MIDKIQSVEASNLLYIMQHLQRNMNNFWIDFYGNVYKFRYLQTDLGYGDLRMKDNTIIKKSKLVKRLFGISESLYSRIVSLCERFIVVKEDGAELLEVYKDYDRTKLIELLQLTDEKLTQAIEDGLITPELSLRELRVEIKRLNGVYEDVAKPTLEELEQIPYTMTYREHWTKQDLGKLSKRELINLYIDLQRKFEDIKKRKIAVSQK